jgi:isoquinoline 1-oxidoreductase beta subunit
MGGAERSAGEEITERVSRRRFLGYVIAAPILVTAADMTAAQRARAAVPTVQPVDFYDLTDLLTDSTMPTAHLITVSVNPDGTVSFSLPRAEVGQGITTAVAMVIADEMDVSVEKVKVTLADARPELMFNQQTQGSDSMNSLYTPVRVAAAAARGRLTRSAARALEAPLPRLTVRDGHIYAPDGRSASYGSLTRAAAAERTARVVAQLKPRATQRVVGTPQPRTDALAAVTGRKVFAMDLDVPNALPTMLCRAPTINGSARAVRNLARVRSMPGITDVVVIPHTQYIAGGVAVRGKTFGQCIDAVRALRVDWGPGTVDGISESDVLRDLLANELPMTPAVGQTLDQRFTFYFRPGDPLEPNCAVADVRHDRAEIWSSLKTPIWVKQTIANLVGLPQEKVTVHVTQGGGSFGRHLFADAAFEAAVISKAIGKPVKLMWHRTDSFRQGRVHPMAVSRVRITYAGQDVLAFDQRHTGVVTDIGEGFGDVFSSMVGHTQSGALGYSQGYFNLTANVPYNFGPVTQELNEIYELGAFNTSSVRSVYGSDYSTALELMVDQTAKVMGQDPYRFRRAFARDARLAAVLDRVASAASWGRPMPPGTAQGIAVHREYKGFAACVAEIDCRPSTVDREIPDAYTGPRVTRVVFVIDVGLPINPLGLEAQMMGGIMDGIAQALSYSLHLQDGHFLEGSWDNAHYTRQWNTPPEVQVIVMPPTTDTPGGAGEFAVPTSMAAVACAYARATGKLPTYFPINHLDVDFKVLPTVPPIPQSPTDGLTDSGPTVKGAG